MQRTPDLAGLQAAPALWSLATLQSRMAQALLAADDAGRELPAALFAGAMPGAEGLRVHRNTVLGGLSHALRQTYPAVDRLVGEAFFDRMAVEFSRVHRPRAPQLGSWGKGFADFIDGFPGTGNLPYLRALAQFDARFDELARRVPDDRHAGVAVPLHGELNLYFTAGLLVHSSNYPVAALREAILADDAVALAAIDLACGEQHVAMWRAAPGVMLQPLGAAAAGYLRALLDGGTSEAALAAALTAGESPEAEVAAQLQQDILQARFVRVATHDNAAMEAGQ
jgi:hypothetical protein